jgi:hypothetical protein
MEVDLSQLTELIDMSESLEIQNGTTRRVAKYDGLFMVASYIPEENKLCGGVRSNVRVFSPELEELDYMARVLFESGHGHLSPTARIMSEIETTDHGSAIINVTEKYYYEMMGINLLFTGVTSGMSRTIMAPNKCDMDYLIKCSIDQFENNEVHGDTPFPFGMIRPTDYPGFNDDWLPSTFCITDVFFQMKGINVRGNWVLIDQEASPIRQNSVYLSWRYYSTRGNDNAYFLEHERAFRRNEEEEDFNVLERALTSEVMHQIRDGESVIVDEFTQSQNAIEGEIYNAGFEEEKNAIMEIAPIEDTKDEANEMAPQELASYLHDNPVLDEETQVMMLIASGQVESDVETEIAHNAMDEDEILMLDNQATAAEALRNAAIIRAFAYAELSDAETDDTIL